MGCVLTYAPAATWNPIADQGKTWSRTVIYKIGGTPFDTTGWAGRMMVRRNYDSLPVVSLTSAPGGGITLGGVTGEIVFFVGADDMEVLVGKYVYDLELYDPNDVEIVYGIIRGTLTVRREVTYV